MTASVRIHPGESPTAAMLDGRRSMAIPEVIALAAVASQALRAARSNPSQVHSASHR